MTAARISLAKEIGSPVVTGKTPQAEREQIYDRFRPRGENRVQPGRKAR